MPNQPDSTSFFHGIIERYDDRAGFGYIRADNNDPTAELLLVHRKSLRQRDTTLVPGDRVAFSAKLVERGLVATDVHHFAPAEVGDSSETDFDLQTDSPTPPAPYDWLAHAIVARDARKYDEAAALYEKGLHSSATVQLILSYAAMEKNRNRRTAAMRVYELGLRLFPKSAKLWEDAGTLAASLGDFSKALRLLENSLSIIRGTSRYGGEKGVLIALARTHFQIDTINSLSDSVTRYEEAMRVFGRGHTRLPESDLLKMNIAKIRTQHHRGNLTVQFLRSAAFDIVRARLLAQTTEGAEFIVSIDDPEFRESYGLARHLIVRCMFKSQIDPSDLNSLDESVAAWARSGLGDEQVALLILASLPADLQRLLSTRIEDRRKLMPAIVPIQQADIETSTEPLAAVRASLDRWLYRRDLFAGNSPVEGRRFFGRDKPLAEIRYAITTNLPSGIFGLRKVGKTSLLKEAQRRAAEVGDLVVYMDLLTVPGDVSDVRWLYWKLGDGLRQEAAKHPLKNFLWRLGGEFTDFLEIPTTFPVATAFDSDLTRLLKLLPTLGISPKPKVVILLDEVERLLPTTLGKAGFTGFFDFFSYLRGVSQENKDFVLIITAANPLVSEAPQFDARDNPVFNFFNEIYLQLLEPSECSLMMRQLGRGMGIIFHKDAIDYVYAMTGGHPFFARQLCSFVAEHHPARPLMVDARIIEHLVDRYLDVRSSDFEEIVERLARDFPEELKICIAIAQSGTGLSVEQLNSEYSHTGTALRHLTGYQIVAVTASKAALTIDLLGRWLRKRYPADE